MDFTHLLRPAAFDDIIGQEHLTASDAPLRLLCEKEALGHSFFYGPAGVGKTSLARVIAKTMQLPFYEFNATSLKIERERMAEVSEKNGFSVEAPIISTLLFSITGSKTSC